MVFYHKGLRVRKTPLPFVACDRKAAILRVQIWSAHKSDIVGLTPGYCWSSYFHVIRLLLLRWILAMFRPSTKACPRHDFRHLGVDQQYPPVIGAADHLSNNPIGQCPETRSICSAQ